MEKIVVKDINELPMRNLTKRQRDHINQEGLNPLRNPEITKVPANENDGMLQFKVAFETKEKLNDYIMDAVYPEYDLGDLDMESYNERAQDIFNRAFLPGVAAVKNSLKSDNAQ